MTFFLGTSLYFLPLVSLGFLKPSDGLKTIGKMTAILMSAYFFYKGVLAIIIGLQTL
jgi:hypothetical protein